MGPRGADEVLAAFGALSCGLGLEKRLGTRDMAAAKLQASGAARSPELGASACFGRFRSRYGDDGKSDGWHG